MIATMVIIAILATAAVSANAKHIRSSKITATTEEAQLFAVDMDVVIAEIGIPSSNQTGVVNDFLDTLEQEYLNFTFDRTTLSLQRGGFTIMASDLHDGFEQPFMLYISTSPENQRAMLISAGVNMKFETASYSTGNFGDDIITIVKERS